jgi:carbon monoxide dehydrogenase subunit G
MGSAEVEIHIDRPVEDVWKVVGDFGGLTKWSPGIESCEVKGDERTLTTMGMELVERMYSRDEQQHQISYGLVGGPLTVDKHVATITVHPDGKGSRVTYAVDVEPDSLLAVMQKTYQGALGALAKYLG